MPSTTLLDPTLLVLSLLGSLAVNALLASAVVLSLRARRQQESEAAPAAAPAAPLSLAPGAPLVPSSTSRRDAIISRIRAGAGGDAVSASTGASRGEVELVARLLALELEQQPELPCTRVRG